MPLSSFKSTLLLIFFFSLDFRLLKWPLLTGVNGLEHNCYLKTESGKVDKVDRGEEKSSNPYFWKLTWAEEFNGDLLNEDLWEVEHEVDTCHGKSKVKILQ